MSKHTPGPWRVSTMLPTNVVASHDGMTVVVASCGNADQLPYEVTDANARLIAAAPEMLTFLRRFVCTGPNRDHLVRLAHDLIIKAEGK